MELHVYFRDMQQEFELQWNLLTINYYFILIIIKFDVQWLFEQFSSKFKLILRIIEVKNKQLHSQGRE